MRENCKLSCPRLLLHHGPLLAAPHGSAGPPLPLPQLLDQAGHLARATEAGHPRHLLPGQAPALASRHLQPGPLLLRGAHPPEAAAGARQTPRRHLGQAAEGEQGRGHRHPGVHHPHSGPRPRVPLRLHAGPVLRQPGQVLLRQVRRQRGGREAAEPGREGEGPPAELQDGEGRGGGDQLGGRHGGLAGAGRRARQGGSGPQHGCDGIVMFSFSINFHRISCFIITAGVLVMCPMYFSHTSGQDRGYSSASFKAMDTSVPATVSPISSGFPELAPDPEHLEFVCLICFVFL